MVRSPLGLPETLTVSTLALPPLPLSIPPPLPQAATARLAPRASTAIASILITCTRAPRGWVPSVLSHAFSIGPLSPPRLLVPVGFLKLVTREPSPPRPEHGSPIRGPRACARAPSSAAPGLRRPAAERAPPHWRSGRAPSSSRRRAGSR